MISLKELQTKFATNQSQASRIQYRCLTNLDIYDSPKCERLATQAAKNRNLCIHSLETDTLKIELCEDNYPGWLTQEQLKFLETSKTPYQPITLSQTEIQQGLPQVIAFTHNAMNTPNQYLWGGTVAPNYDCSGLMQAAFLSVGVWLPRDAYQQEAFTEPLKISELQPGDLIFFGNPQKATHVALYLGDKKYIHSSGKEAGRNGIGIDILSEKGDEISRAYYKQLRGFGRVIKPYLPTH
ncbi:C40 family peptidase [Ancylothrix sp. C2]|uniref:C40 family peptidase n=1 Tax=Ancylothrix sp. D3o TaxID=2953691 RepID=UPI0021BBB0BF|nr:C40 family peptidase [Ancylothrix sp. D3o]MCT7949898.1 C40 family peptidase [Ancylothrix sp. D3o]